MKVVKEGEHEDQFWETISTTAYKQVDTFVPSDETVPEDTIPTSLFTSGNQAKDIAQVCIEEFQVDCCLGLSFYVLKGIIELKKQGLFTCALIKKHHYWPTLVPGNEMNSHCAMDGVQVDDTDAIQGVSMTSLIISEP